MNEIRAAGGLFIADEVQPGFGRTGERMWGFQRHDVVPDIVTMGKPMGNGHPIAAIAARPQWLAEFARRTRYFNTFGGNTVSCAVALAVLEVIEQENLLQNAHKVGHHLRRGLEELARRHDCVGEVRGAGLFLGVQLRATSGGTFDSRDLARSVVNDLKSRGVLIGTAGRNADVLKIRPPLPLARAQSDQLLELSRPVARHRTALGGLHGLSERRADQFPTVLRPVCRGPDRPGPRAKNRAAAGSPARLADRS